jgi:hypothetical protein
MKQETSITSISHRMKLIIAVAWILYKNNVKTQGTNNLHGEIFIPHMIMAAPLVKKFLDCQKT